MPVRKAQAVWEGTLREGNGRIKLGSGAFEGTYSFGTRFEQSPGTNPEELIAAAHAGICWREDVVEWLEAPCYSQPGKKFMYEWPLAAEILVEPLQIVSGDLVVPREPGLGIKVDERVIEKYPWQPGPWSNFTLISPPETHAVTSDHSLTWSDAKPGA